MLRSKLLTPMHRRQYDPVFVRASVSMERPSPRSQSPWEALPAELAVEVLRLVVLARRPALVPYAPGPGLNGSTGNGRKRGSPRISVASSTGRVTPTQGLAAPASPRESSAVPRLHRPRAPPELLFYNKDDILILLLLAWCPCSLALMSASLLCFRCLPCLTKNLPPAQ